MQDAINLKDLGANPVNGEERKTAKEQFTRSCFATKSTTVGKSGK